MDRISDSGSDDLGSNPGGVTPEPAIFIAGFFYDSRLEIFL